MTAAATIVPPHPLVGEALGRVGAVAGGADHPAWLLPAVPLRGDRLDDLIAFAALDHGEALAVTLLAAIECDAALARTIAALQAPVAGSRALAGLLASLFAAEGLTVAGLWSGSATTAGLIVWGDEPAPLPERTVSLPPWLAVALAGFAALPPGVHSLAQPPVPLPDGLAGEAAAHARDLLAAPSGAPRLLVVRAPSPAEGEAMARLVATASGREPCDLREDAAPGLGAWLAVTRRLPLLHRAAGPGESIDLSAYDGIRGPLLLVTGREGQVIAARQRREWRAGMPIEPERAQLWRAWGLGKRQAAAAAGLYRQSAGRIAEIGRQLAAEPQQATLPGIAAAMRTSGGAIDALARRATAEVRRDDIVLPPALADALGLLRDRIRLRNTLGEGLGPTIAARYRPGDRALLTGESGTGKTLAVHWLAREAGLPLYWVDLAALTSKWIGETEKNLAQLFEAAEHGDVMLFFDEADSLFGARTEVGDAHDRYANSQTNFLLQRIEEFDGVALLATNGRERFDPAFVRRLDMILEFPLPDAAARRLLWERHLGAGHGLAATQVDLIAARIDLAGGHVRNMVLSAAVRARANGRGIEAADIAAAAGEEYAKLGRTAPPLATG